MPVRDEAYMQKQKQRIMEAAFRCFSRQGFQKTSLRSICKEANLAVGTFYVHFKDRSEILAAMKSMASSKPLKDIRFSRWSEFVDHLTSMIDFQKNPDSVKYVVCDLKLAAEALGNEELATLFRQSSMEMQAWMKKCLAQFVESGDIELPLGIDTTARALRCLINGMITSQLFEEPGERGNLTEDFNQVLNRLVRAN